MTSYYIDTCIYLNLWQKEESFSGIKYWKIAQRLFELIEENNENVYYSGFILKEMSFILNKKEFEDKIKLFEATSNFKKIFIEKSEMDDARKIEDEIGFEVSFYDIIHMILARKSKSILVTRDKRLMKIAKKSFCELDFFQSNHEGAIIDFLQKESSRKANGVLINPGALVRYGYSLRQALIDFDKPFIEVHMTDINKTGVNISVNVLEDIRTGQTSGLREKSYYNALEKLVSHLNKIGNLKK